MDRTRRLLLQSLAALPLGGLALPTLAAKHTGKTLILVELKGGNDGLNTLVPFEADAYRRLRPSIGVDSSEVIPFDNSAAVGPVGLNTNLSALEAALGEDFAVVQGLGYPNQNRSHFKSIQLWETGGDGNQAEQTGWVTASLERTYAREAVTAHGASLSGSLDVFTRGDGIYVSMARLQQMQAVQASEASETTNRLMALIQRRKNEAATVASSLTTDLARFPASRIPYRMKSSDFSGQLTEALRVIGAEIPLPVLHVQHGSFDTHEAQIWQHPRLLQRLSEGLARFRQNLIAMGRWNDVLIMTYSEFGRRAAENGSEGTDHGTASTHFLMGGSVTPGLYGEHPSLDRLEDGDMVHTMDYRALYELVCRRWLGDTESRFQAFQDPALAALLG